MIYEHKTVFHCKVLHNLFRSMKLKMLSYAHVTLPSHSLDLNVNIYNGK